MLLICQLCDAQEYFVWSQQVTARKPSLPSFLSFHRSPSSLLASLFTACAHVNPGIAAQLEELYKTGMFLHSGKTYKCHPNYQ